MIRPLLAAALLALASTPAAAQANPDPAAVQAGTYKVEAAHTRVLFSVSHMGFSTWYGDFTGAEGTLTLDPKQPAAASVDVSVKAGSISTTNAKLDSELRAPDWFDAGKFPTVRFRSTKVTPTGPGRADVAGELTLHGVTRPVVLQARFNGGGANPMSKAYTVGFEGSGRIRRSDFGVNKYVPVVGDDVTLIISAAFEKQ